MMISKESKDVTTNVRSSLNFGVKKRGIVHWSTVEVMNASLTRKAAGNVVVRMWRRWIVVVEMKSRVAPESISTRSCLLYRVRTVMTRSSEWEVVGGKGGVGVVVADRGDEVGEVEVGR